MSVAVADDLQPSAELLRQTQTDEPPCRRILLIRHGHYERVDQLGDEVWGLSPLGRRQAVRTGRRLARILHRYPGKLEGVYSSPWPRALQTAQIAAHELGLDRVRLKSYLHETTALVPAGPDGVRSVHPQLPVTSAIDRLATVNQVRRVLARFFRSSRQPSSFLIFTHGNLIRYLLADTLGLPYEIWMRVAICHASITEIRVFPGNVPALICFNETGHLSPHLITA